MIQSCNHTSYNHEMMKNDILCTDRLIVLHIIFMYTISQLKY